MTTKESMKYLNKLALITHQGLVFQVRIEDVRERQGLKEFLVFPVHGDGSLWTSNIDIIKEVENEM